MRRHGGGLPDALPLALGAMSFAGVYQPTDETTSQATLAAALDAGIRIIDTADVYGFGLSEEIVGRGLKGRRDEAILATKFGLVVAADEQGRPALGVDGSPAYAAKALEGSLRRLDTDHVDVWFLHRVDRRVPVEETVGAMAEQVAAGKVRFLGLSEVSAETLRAAHAVHPISVVQSECSLWARDAEPEVLPACAELDVAFWAFSPLGRGFLTGAVRSPDDLGPEDFRRGLPRFQGEAFQANLDLVRHVVALAERKGCTPAQLALAWVLSRGEHVFALFGTRRAEAVQENLGALEVTLSAAELEEIDRILPAPVGERYATQYRAAWD